MSSAFDDPRFEAYLRDSFAALVARLRAAFSDRVAAEDVVQEALIRAWQLDARREEVRALEPWVAVVATNLARSRWRTLRAEDDALERLGSDRSRDQRDDLSVPGGPGLPERLAGALGELPRRQGQVVVLHYYGDLSVGDIARRLGISEGTVKRALYDARSELRRLLADDQRLQPDRRKTMAGWHMAGTHPRQYEHDLAENVAYEGKRVARLRCVVPRADGFGTLMQTFSAERYREQRVRFAGALKCKDIEDRVGLWMRVDPTIAGRPLAFDNMADRPIRGTVDWQRCEVVLDVPAEAEAIAFGVLLVGAGEAWLSDLAVEIVGGDVETTDKFDHSLPDEPQNLDFTEEFAKP